ncbi:MAG: peptidyl-prolyl cis-trans isomerase [Sandaracinus sp.]
MRALPLLVLGLVLVPSLGRAQAPAPTAAPAPTTAAPTPTDVAPAPTPDDAARRARVVARVGDVTITLGEIEDEINHQSPFMRARFRDRAHLEEHVRERIRMELLAREGRRRGYGDAPDVVEAVRQTSVQLLLRHDFDERITASSISAEEVREYYDAHPAEFHQPEMRRASEIVLDTREAADALAAQAHGADVRAFRALVTEHSTDAETRQRGGDLRYFDAEGHLANHSDPTVPIEAAQAAFAIANVGEVSDVFAQGSHFAILQLTGIRPAEHRDVSAADASIRARLWRSHRETAIETFLAGLRERIPTEVFYERMRDIRMEAPERLSADPPEDEAEGDPDEREGAPLSPDQILGGSGAAPPSSTTP